MSIPLPGPYDEDEDDGDDGGLAAAWHECLEWAERGDVEHLARMLRSDASLQDDPFVRAFLADVLDGKIKRPRGKPVKRPERAWWINPDGTPAMIDIRDKRRLEIVRSIRDNKASHEAAAAHFRMHVESVRHLVRRAKPKRSR